MTSRETPVDASPPMTTDESRDLTPYRCDVVPMTPSMRRRPDDAIEQTRPATKAPQKTREADLKRWAICSLLGAVDADLDGLAERRADLQVHPRQRGRLERRRGVAEERGQPVQRYCFRYGPSACGVDFCVDYCFDFSSGDCCHLSALALGLRRMSFLRLSPRDGARFAAGFARCGCGLRSSAFVLFRAQRWRCDLGCYVKSGNSQMLQKGFYS